MTTPGDPSAERVFTLPRWPWLLVPAILLFVAALGIQVWLRGHQQRAAVRTVKEARGRVVIEPGGPQWLRKQIGDERMALLFDNVVEVDLDGSDFNDLW